MGNAAVPVPLTRGRDLVPETLWNMWTEANTVISSDRRYGLDLKNRAGSVSAGIDRRLTNDVVAGVSVAVSASRATAFDETLRSESNGFSIGPYFAMRLSQHIAMDASFNYGRTKNEVQLAILSGSSMPEIYSGSANIHGQFDYGPYFIRPKLSVFYSHVRTGAHDLSGTLFSLPVHLRFPDSQFDSGVFEASGEVSRIFALANGMSIMPYIQPSVVYAFLRPNGGEVLTGDFRIAVPSAWTGTVRGGLRMSVNSVLVELAGGYLSIGQPDLDVWEAKLRLSVGF